MLRKHCFFNQDRELISILENRGYSATIRVSRYGIDTRINVVVSTRDMDNSRTVYCNDSIYRYSESSSKILTAYNAEYDYILNRYFAIL